MSEELSAPIPLKTEIAESSNVAQLERYVTANGNNVRRRANMPTIEDELTPELALHVYVEFIDITSNSRLSLGTGALKFEFFRQVLKGTARSHWDAAALEVGGTTNDNFQEARVLWLSNYLEPTSYHDQKQYLNKSVKPFSFTCKLLASRLKKIKTYMALMPGAPDNPDHIYPEPEWKILFYNMMRPNWRTAFDASGNTITDANYTFDNLVLYMYAQEKQERTQRALSGRRGGRGNGRGDRGGRRGGRGGRGGGRNRYRDDRYQGGWINKRPWYSSGNYIQDRAAQRPRYTYGTRQVGYGRGGRWTPRAGQIQQASARGGRGRASPRGGRGGNRGGRYAHLYAAGAPVPFDDGTLFHVDDEPAQPEPVEAPSAPAAAYQQQEETHWMHDMYGAFDEEAPDDYDEGYGDC